VRWTPFSRNKMKQNPVGHRINVSLGSENADCKSMGPGGVRRKLGTEEGAGALASGDSLV
jgi:hypothetical protein